MHNSYAKERVKDCSGAASGGLLDPVGQQAALVRIDGERALERGDGALVAVAPLADPAGDADRLVGGVVADVEVVGIDEGARMGISQPRPIA